MCHYRLHKVWCCILHVCAVCSHGSESEDSVQGTVIENRTDGIDKELAQGENKTSKIDKESETKEENTNERSSPAESKMNRSDEDPASDLPQSDDDSAPGEDKMNRTDEDSALGSATEDKINRSDERQFMERPRPLGEDVSLSASLEEEAALLPPSNSSLVSRVFKVAFLGRSECTRCLCSLSLNNITRSHLRLCGAFVHA